MRAALLVLPLVAAAACGGSAVHAPSPLVGTWTFTSDPHNLIKLTLGKLYCDGTDSMNAPYLTPPLAGVSVRLTEVAAGLQLDIGCRCHITMTASGRHATAVQNPQQTCELVTDNYQVTATVHDWQVDLDPGGGVLTVKACGNASAVKNMPAQGVPQVVAAGFTIGGLLAPAAERSPHCGDDRNAVGVLPYFAAGVNECPIGTGFEGVEFFMQGEHDPICSWASGLSGEPAWLYPEAPKQPPPTCPTAYPGPFLGFCRVDGSLFSSARIQGPTAAAYNYAVLKLNGDNPCPAGSEEVTRHISNEDNDNRDFYAGRPEPNKVVGQTGVGFFTELHFCVFRARAAAPSAEDAGPDNPDPFPDLGFPYAVFHDFEGFQPPWVIRKAWFLSTDEAPRNDDFYCPSTGAATDALAAMVEGDRVATTTLCQAPVREVDNATTVFDIARVR